MSTHEKWLKVELPIVLQHYADGFEMNNGTEILSREYFVDTSKNVVLFKIVTAEAHPK